jgi:two-component system phosphate regulon sensor histidine kinase PhoR
MLAEDDALALTQDAGSWSKIFMQMYQQSMRMEKIIADLLWLSGLESDSNLEESQEKIYVKQLIQEIVSEAKSLSGMRNHDIDIDVDDSLTMKGERKLLYSAFSNLIFNAVNYTPPNGKIKIDTYITERHFVLTISDTGIGIDKKHIPRLTERFYRVDKARSRDEGGTGLGLAIVKHVLLRYRANLEIESEPGKGSSFHCMFQKSILEDC